MDSIVIVMVIMVIVSALLPQESLPLYNNTNNNIVNIVNIVNI